MMSDVVRVVVASLLLFGCGRFGFGDDDSSIDAMTDGDGVELGMGGTQTSTPGFPGPWQHVAVIAGTSAPQELRYQLRDASGAGAIMDALASIAIPFDAADIAYAANDAPHDVTSATATADSVLSLGPLSGEA
jgi:hypothetical protein